MKYIDEDVSHRVIELYWARSVIFHAIRFYLWLMEHRQYMYHTEFVSP